MRRLLIILALILVVLAAAWVGGWFWLAGWAGANADDVLAQLEERGLQVDCSRRDIVGFPFALRMDCGETAVTEADTGTQAHFAGLTGGGSVFAPMTATVSLAAPAEIRSPLLPAPAEFRWQAAHMDVGLGTNGPRDVGFEARNLDAGATLPDGRRVVLTARHAEAQVGPSGDGGTAAAASFGGLALAVDGTAYPPVDGRAALRLSPPPRALLSGRAGLQAPLSANGIDVLLRSGAARLQVSGDLTADAEGILDGTLRLRMAGTEALPAFIAALPAEHQKLGNAVAGGLIAFGTPTTLDGDPASELRVVIEHGEAQVGPVEVTVPRLPL